jgi:hypothetical protein
MVKDTIEHPEEFRQNEERDKYAFSPAGCFNRRAGSLGLLGVVIQVGPCPHVGVGG